MDELTDATPEAPVDETVHTDDTSVQDSDPFESGADTFDRNYVERLRKESAQYRTRAKEYEDYAKAFEPYNDEDRQVWQEAMRLFNEDPKQGADYLERIAQAVKAGFSQEQAEAIADAGDSDAPLTRADLDRIFAEKDEQAKQAAEVARIEAEAKALGYDPSDPLYTTLLTIASKTPSGSLEAAHKQLEARFQARIDAYLAEKAKDAEQSHQPPAEAGQVPSTERQLRTFDDARAAAEARAAAAFTR